MMAVDFAMETNNARKGCDEIAAGFTIMRRYLLVLISIVSFSCSDNSSSTNAQQTTARDSLTTITFNQHIAPIVFSHCSSCHRPGESAPFSLLTYDDVYSHRRQIVEVTKDRFMPPWPPELGHLPFLGERKLSAEQIAEIAAWVDSGAKEGDSANPPKAPVFISGWQLGEPDLVVEMEQPFPVPAGGGDVFRNFVVKVPLAKDQYVAAYEFRAGNPRVVHHADIRTDPTNSLRDLDSIDDEPGFDGLLDLSVTPPGGVFLGWTPGRVPAKPNPKISWPLHKGGDMLFQLHLQPTGKTETVKSSIGIYFAKGAPEKIPFTMSLGCRSIDIAPGVDDYTIERSYTLPVDAYALSVYPHAHYLGKRIHGSVVLPDGTKTTLIEINNWNFNWQDQYTFREPFFLPAGSKITLNYTYDNSAENLLNPNRPPQRVTYGPRSINEMGELNLQLILNSEEEFKKLDDDFKEFHLRSSFNDFEEMLRSAPDNVLALGGLASVHIARGEPELASRYLLKEIELRENDVHKSKALLQLAIAHYQLGKLEDAEQALLQATRISPSMARGWYLLGDFLGSQGRFTEALGNYLRGLERDPENILILEKVGDIRLKNNEPLEAKNVFNQILKIDPTNFNAHFNLGALMLREQNLAEAIRHFEAAAKSRPQVAQTYNQLGIAHGMLREFEKAIQSFEKALEIDGELSDSHLNLAMIYEEMGQHELAVRHYRHRLKLPDPPINVTVKLAWILATSPDETVRNPQEAVRLAEIGANSTNRSIPIVLDRLAAAYAAAGKFEAAIATSEQAVQLADQKQQTSMAREMESRLSLYRQKLPYRQPKAP
jgi:tetratricopeptide (TPR) repeat protein